MNARLYGAALKNIVMGNIIWGDSTKVMLLKASYQPNTPSEGYSQDTHEFISDVSGYEITGTNYTAGGKALSGMSLNFNDDDDPGGVFELLADDLTWSTLTTDDDIKYAAIYNVNSEALIGYVTFTSNISLTAEDLVLEWSDGIVGSIRLDDRTDGEFTGLVCRLYAGVIGHFLVGDMAWGSDNWIAALMRSDYAPDQDVDLNWSDIAEYEVTGEAYTPQLLTFPSPANSYLDSPSGYGGRQYFLADDTTFPKQILNENIRWIVIYCNTGIESPILGYIKLAENIKPRYQDISISFDTGVVFSLVLDPAGDV